MTSGPILMTVTQYYKCIFYKKMQSKSATMNSSSLIYNHIIKLRISHLYFPPRSFIFFNHTRKGTHR